MAATNFQVNCPRDWRQANPQISEDQDLINYFAHYFPTANIVLVRRKDRSKKPFCLWEVEVVYFHTAPTGDYRALLDLAETNKPRNTNVHSINVIGMNRYSIELKMAACRHRKVDFISNDKTQCGRLEMEMKPVPVVQLVQRVATSMQEYAQSGGVRSFGVSLICGWDSGRSYLFHCDPSGSYFAWKATAMGKNSINGKTLDKRYNKDLELDDVVHTTILTLKEGFEGQISADNIEVGICDQNGFRRLDVSTVKDYLANIP